MNDALQSLCQLLTLVPLDQQCFQSQRPPAGLGSVFGGQLVAQALYSASRTVTTERPIHSLHCYFVRPASRNTPIEYHVDILRDGLGASARRVTASQNGSDVFFFNASFQSPRIGVQHQTSNMPEVPPPQDLENEQQLAMRYRHEIPEHYRRWFLRERPFDIRPVGFYHPFEGGKHSAVRQVWIKAQETVSDPFLHRCLLAYVSDTHLLPVCLQPHGKGFLHPSVRIASIDHSLWFHRPVDINQWMLYQVISPVTNDGRGFVRGEFYSQQGDLLVSVAQEGMIRCR